MASRPDAAPREGFRDGVGGTRRALLFGVKPITARVALNSVLAGLKPELPLVSAVQMLQEHGISGAAVVDDAGQPIGVLSEEGCLRLLAASAYERADDATVADAMTTPAPTVSADAPLPVVAERMLEAETSCVLVLNDEDILVGQVNREDLLDAMLELVTGEREGGRFVGPQDHPGQRGSLTSWAKRRLSVRDSMGTATNEVYRKAFESGAPEEGGEQHEDYPYPGHRRTPPNPTEKPAGR